MVLKNVIGYNYRLFLMALFVFSINVSAQPLLLVSGEFAPYSGEHLPHQGMTSEIVESAFKEAGISVLIDFLPWKRGFLYTSRNKYFGTFPYVIDDERKKHFLFSDSTYSAKVHFFVSDRFDHEYKKDSDLKGLSVCVPIGYSAKEIQRFLDASILEQYVAPTNESCFQLLKKGRVQLYSVNEVTGWETIKKLYGTTQGFRTVGKALQENHYYLMVSKSYPKARELLDIFNKGVIKIKRKGIYRQIIKKHLGI